MLKRGITRSNEVLPSTVTSTTAQGFLPQYNGHGTLAAASFSPVMGPSPGTPACSSPSKSSDGGAPLYSPIAEKHVENRLPAGNVGPASLEEQFRNIVSLDAKHRSTLPSHWKGN